MAVTITAGAGAASTTIYTSRIPNRGAGLQQAASTSFAAPISPLLPQIRPFPGARRTRTKSLTLRFVMTKDREPGGGWSAEADAADKLVDADVSRGGNTATSGGGRGNTDDAVGGGGGGGVGVTVPNLAEDYERQISALLLAEKLARKKSERFTYLVAAVMSSLGITSMAVMAVYCRFSWQMEGQDVPMTEMFGTFALSVGAAVGMEFWARWAHKALWHASLWHMHESHHKPREGPFELNDVFAIVNSIPAIALLSYGFFHKGLFPGLCFGAGLGITVFGMAYMFVHDGLVHKRFPVGPIANVPYFRKVAAAHQLHHSEKFNGVPYGLFLGPQELEEVGGLEELDKEISRRIKMYKQKQHQQPPSA